MSDLLLEQFVTEGAAMPSSSNPPRAVALSVRFAPNRNLKVVK